MYQSNPWWEQKHRVMIALGSGSLARRCRDVDVSLAEVLRDANLGICSSGRGNVL